MLVYLYYYRFDFVAGKMNSRSFDNFPQNLLIAMLNTSYEEVMQDAEKEHSYEMAQIVMSYKAIRRFTSCGTIKNSNPSESVQMSNLEQHIILE